MKVWLQKDRLLCDGTPRREKGWRAYVEVPRIGPFQQHDGVVKKRVMRSPCLPSKQAAKDWVQQ